MVLHLPILWKIEESLFSFLTPEKTCDPVCFHHEELKEQITSYLLFFFFFFWLCGSPLRIARGVGIWYLSVSDIPEVIVRGSK
jgi:hypothetical protein